jgi:hypothetical protein
MAEFCCAEQVEIWAYFMMPNPVHWIVEPLLGIAAENSRRRLA